METAQFTQYESDILQMPNDLLKISIKNNVTNTDNLGGYPKQYRLTPD